MKTGCRRTALSTVGQSELHPGDGLEVRHFGRTRFLPNWQPAPIKAPAFLPWGSRRLAVRGRLAGGERWIRTLGPRVMDGDHHLGHDAVRRAPTVRLCGRRRSVATDPA